jgi:prepilin-type N-terminal cleavage/methylation domain-containing protein
VRRRRTRGQRGFTLIELLVTLGITTIGLIGLLALHGSVSRGNSGTSRGAEAQQIATAALESLRAQRIGEMSQSLTGSISSPPIDATMPDVVGRNGLVFRRRCVVSQLAASSSLWRVRVEVSWTDEGATQGAEGGKYDHLIGIEVIRTIEEAL